MLAGPRHVVNKDATGQLLPPIWRPHLNRVLSFDQKQTLIPGRGTFSNPVPGRGTFSNPVPGRGTSSNPVPGRGTSSNPVPGRGTFSNPVPGRGTSSNPVPGRGTFSNPVPGRGTSRPWINTQPSPTPTARTPQQRPVRDEFDVSRQTFAAHGRHRPTGGRAHRHLEYARVCAAIEGQHLVEHQQHHATHHRRAGVRRREARYIAPHPTPPRVPAVLILMGGH